MNILEIEKIIQSFDQDDADIYAPRSDIRHAAVAAILRPSKDKIDALFILRAKKSGDPWSGQIAFPGGHYETSDVSLRHTAERETVEEIGLDLTKDARFIGKIDDVEANPRGRNIRLNVSPYVFVLENPNAELTLNHEVAEVIWGSLDDMYTGSSATSRLHQIQGQTEEFPGYRVGSEVVWGLTLRMLDLFFAKIDPAWQSDQR
ncbi:MAG: CoA pyrophosphatase [Pseudomonadales bacterium]|nr:CoA pyrophosphatase [Pseudomonadales bacterium]